MTRLPRHVRFNADISHNGGAIGNSLSVAKEIILNSDSFAVLTEVVVHDELRAGLLKATDMPISTAYWYRIRAIRR